MSCRLDDRAIWLPRADSNRDPRSQSAHGAAGHTVACSGLRPDPVRPAVGRHGMVAGGGIEPPTSGFRDRRSATELTRSVGGPTGLEPAYLEPQSSALPLSYSPHEKLVGSAGLEPTASAPGSSQSSSPAPRRRPRRWPAIGLRPIRVLAPRQRSTRLSYDPFWSEWADSNRRPRGPKPRALPTELHPDVV